MKTNIKRAAGFLIILCSILSLPMGHDAASVSAGTAAPAVMTDNSVSIVSSFGEDPATERNFTWETPKPIRTGQVEYCPKSGFKGFDSNNIIAAQAEGYVSNTDQGARMIYRASLEKLQPGTEYVYRIRTGKSTASRQGTFRTAGKAPEQFTFLQITDTQGSNAKDYRLWKNTLDVALSKYPDARFLVHTGDMVDDGQKIDQWDLFTGAAEQELMNLPIEPVVGNHESLNKNGTNPDMKNFTDRFDLPDESDAGAPAGTVYSFDYGYAHIAVLNTECSIDNLKKEGAWLLSDMAGSDRPWKIVALHRGLYGATYDSATVRDLWSPVFDQAGIDLVLQGHDHNYVRTFPMKEEQRVKSGKGTIYITANSGGVKMYPKKKRSWQAVDLQPNVQMFVAVTVDKEKLAVNAYDVKNNLIDSLILKK